jgi:hypothetical protein
MRLCYVLHVPLQNFGSFTVHTVSTLYIYIYIYIYIPTARGIYIYNIQHILRCSIYKCMHVKNNAPMTECTH